ncbi:MAG: histidinol dehydrogenase, partial [Kiritimatiellae bacterium]|nr:histidinol dehydrogenase [Kiritimatiellia bacterium]
MIKIVTSKSPVLTAFNARPAFPEEAEVAAAKVLADIRRNGDKAVLEAVAKFEGFKARRAKDLRVGCNRLQSTAIDRKTLKAVKDAHARVLGFAKASLRKAWSMKTPRGGTAGEFFSPMDRIGVYIPGGTAPLASTSVMTVTLAKAAGVKEIVACTPAGKDGKVNPVL